MLSYNSYVRYAHILLIFILFFELAEGGAGLAFAQSAQTPSTITVTSSAKESKAGALVIFAATVIGSGGHPTGTVILKDGSNDLGSALLTPNGTASISISDLAEGHHTITAQYGGDAQFAGSNSAPLIQIIQPAPGMAEGTPPNSAWLILLLAIISVALLLLLRRFVFLVVGRSLRILWRLVARFVRLFLKPIIRLLRLLRIISKVPPKGKPAIAVQSAVGISAAAITQAFSGETEEAIKRNFDPTSVKIQRNKQFLCTWLSPLGTPHPAYDKEKAEADFSNAKRFFIADIPTQSNPLNLYDDIDGAFIVNLLKESDNSCFYVLSEFKRVINNNVMILAILFSIVVSIVAIANLLASTYLDFYTTIGLDKYMPIYVEFLDYNFDIPADTFNKMVFGTLSCLLGFFVMWFFYHTEYAQFQRYNGQQLNNFLVEYLANININYRQIHTNATQTILEEKDVEGMKHDTVLWITNLQWMAFRGFFIEHFLRNMLFQIRRNSSYMLIFIPLFFIISMLIASYIFNIKQINVFDTHSNVYSQNVFYVFFAWLLSIYYGYLSQSVSFIWESIAERRWSKFGDLNIQDAMTRIMDSYVVQLDRWRTMMKSRG